MLVCHCKRVSDRAIKAAIAGGATCRSTVGKQCGAGTGCGGCLPTVDRLLESEQREGTMLRGLPIVVAV